MLAEPGALVNPNSRKPLRSCAFAMLVALCAGATAQGYPAKPIHIIAPFPAGGGYDFLSRLPGAEMTKTFGQPVIVENKAGANRSEERRVGKEAGRGVTGASLLRCLRQLWS